MARAGRAGSVSAGQCYRLYSIPSAEGLVQGYGSSTDGSSPDGSSSGSSTVVYSKSMYSSILLYLKALHISDIKDIQCIHYSDHKETIDYVRNCYYYLIVYGTEHFSVIFCYYFIFIVV